MLRAKTQKKLESNSSTQNKKAEMKNLSIGKMEAYVYTQKSENLISLTSLSKEPKRMISISQNQISNTYNLVQQSTRRNKKLISQQTVATQKRLPTKFRSEAKKTRLTIKEMKPIKIKKEKKAFASNLGKHLNKCKSQENLKIKMHERKGNAKGLYSLNSFLSHRSQTSNVDPFNADDGAKKRLIIRNYHSLDRKKKEQIEKLLINR